MSGGQASGFAPPTTLDNGSQNTENP